jgi:hypothetical protein
MSVSCRHRTSQNYLCRTLSVQAHFIFTVLQPLKTTKHPAQTLFTYKPHSAAAHYHRVVGHKPHEVINATCSPRAQNDLVTMTGSLSRASSACDAVILHKATIAPIQERDFIPSAQVSA